MIEVNTLEEVQLTLAGVTITHSTGGSTWTTFTTTNVVTTVGGGGPPPP